MEQVEIQRIREYIIELEEGLYEWDYRGITTLGNLAELYRIIERLMEATSKRFNLTGKDRKAILDIVKR